MAPIRPNILDLTRHDWFIGGIPPIHYAALPPSVLQLIRHKSSELAKTLPSTPQNTFFVFWPNATSIILPFGIIDDFTNKQTGIIAAKDIYIFTLNHLTETWESQILKN